MAVTDGSPETPLSTRSCTKCPATGQVTAHMSQHNGSDSRITRRQALAGGVTACVGGVGLLTVLSDGVSAQIEMGDLSIDGDSATLAEPPAAIDLSVSGEWSVDANSPPPQCRTTLQLQTQEGHADDLDEQLFFDTTSGKYSLTTDIYQHDEISQGHFFPNEGGATKTRDLLARVILSVVEDGSVAFEKIIEAPVTVELTKEGMVLHVGGEGTTSIVPV